MSDASRASRQELLSATIVASETSSAGGTPEPAAPTWLGRPRRPQRRGRAGTRRGQHRPRRPTRRRGEVAKSLAASNLAAGDFADQTPTLGGLRLGWRLPPPSAPPAAAMPHLLQRPRPSPGQSRHPHWQDGSPSPCSTTSRCSSCCGGEEIPARQSRASSWRSRPPPTLVPPWGRPRRARPVLRDSSSASLAVTWLQVHPDAARSVHELHGAGIRRRARATGSQIFPRGLGRSVTSPWPRPCAGREQVERRRRRRLSAERVGSKPHLSEPDTHACRTGHHALLHARRPPSASRAGDGIGHRQGFSGASPTRPGSGFLDLTIEHARIVLQAIIIARPDRGPQPWAPCSACRSERGRLASLGDAAGVFLTVPSFTLLLLLIQTLGSAPCHHSSPSSCSLCWPSCATRSPGDAGSTRGGGMGPRACGSRRWRGLARIGLPLAWPIVVARDPRLDPVPGRRGRDHPHDRRAGAGQRDLAGPGQRGGPTDMDRALSGRLGVGGARPAARHHLLLFVGRLTGWWRPGR